MYVKENFKIDFRLQQYDEREEECNSDVCEEKVSSELDAGVVSNLIFHKTENHKSLFINLKIMVIDFHPMFFEQ